MVHYLNHVPHALLYVPLSKRVVWHPVAPGRLRLQPIMYHLTTLNAKLARCKESIYPSSADLFFRNRVVHVLFLSIGECTTLEIVLYKYCTIALIW